MGLLQQNAGDFTAARTWFEKSVARNPDYADSHFHLGLVLAALNDNAAAKEQLEKAIALGFNEPQVHSNLAGCTVPRERCRGRSNNFSCISRKNTPN